MCHPLALSMASIRSDVAHGLVDTKHRVPWPPETPGPERLSISHADEPSPCL